MTVPTEDDEGGRDGGFISRLHDLCSLAVPRTDETPIDELPVREREEREESRDSALQAVREWLLSHPGRDNRARAASFRGRFQTTPLHMLCKIPGPPGPPPDILGSVLGCQPEAAGSVDNNGWVPLHHACANGAGYRSLAMLCDVLPSAKVAQDLRGRTPLHFTFFRSQVGGGGLGTRESEEANAAAIVSLLSDTGAAELADEGGMLPMHYACAYGTPDPVLRVLASAHPVSTVATEKKGRTPLHLAMVNAHRVASPEAVRFLLEASPPEAVNASDKSGHLPISLLALTSKQGNHGPDANENAALCLDYYLDAQPRPTAEFLSAVQSLPEWLRDRAVSHIHIHNVLNARIVKRFPSSILILDGYMQILQFVAFTMNAMWHIDKRFEGTDLPQESRVLLILQFVAAAYFLVMEFAQVISMLALGSFKKWCLNVTNWIDLAAIFLALFYGILMTEAQWSVGVVGVDLFRAGVAVTQCLFLLSFVLYLKSTLVGFAVFVNGVVFVVRRLSSFLVSAAVILVAFALSFLNVFSTTELCYRDVNGVLLGEQTNPHCTFGRSLLKTYTMILGEVGDVANFYRENLVSQILFVMYAFLVVIVFATVLIAIVVDNYGVIRNERSAMVFWSNRLDFILEMDAMARAFTCGKLKVGLPGRKEGSGPFRRGWASAVSLFEPDANHDKGDSPCVSVQYWCYDMIRLLLAFVIIPIWIASGILTAGWLWPPQVREYLFMQGGRSIPRSDVLEREKVEVASLREEVGDLRSELRREMLADRRELGEARAELDSVQMDVVADLSQVNEVLTTLLGMNRERARREGGL